MATPAIPANCAAVTEQLLLETGRLQEPMFQRAALKRPIIRLQSKNRGAWRNGMGVTVGAVTFERSFPAFAGDNWGTVAVSDGDSVNACLPPTETVNFGQTTRTYGVKHKAVNTERFCIKDINYGWQFEEFMGLVNKSLTDISEWVWYNRYTLDYFSNAGHHLTLSKTAGVQDSTTVYNTSNLPTANLSQGVLDNIYSNLMREATRAAVDMDTGAPVFTLITSAETSKHIVNDNPALRTDMRYAYMGKGEMTPILPGMEYKRRNFGGFVHDIDPYPRRFIFSGGAYVEVAPFISSSTTKGNMWNLNPAYLNAPFEESIVWVEDVVQQQAVNLNNNPAPGWNFQPNSWMGDFTPRNILHDTCNPDGDIIYMRALFASAAKPGNPYVGWTILHSRCGYDNDLRNCYEYAS